MTLEKLLVLIILWQAMFALISIAWLIPSKIYYIINKEDFDAQFLAWVTHLKIFKELASVAFYRVEDKEIPQVGDIVINTINFADKQARVIDRIWYLDGKRRIPVLVLENL